MMPDIRLPVFEGPLELLLHLIERDDLDVTAVSLVAVTDQYISAVRAAEGDNLPALAEFVSIGAKLIYLKSKALLPRPAEDAADDLEEDEVGQELVDLLKEYRKFRPVADALAERQEAGIRTNPRPITAEVPGTAALHDVTLDVLRRLMLDALKRQVPTAPPAIVQSDQTIPLRDRIRQLHDLLKRGEKLSFRALIGAVSTRGDVVVTFLAVLELLKAGDCDVRQSRAWDDIEIVAPTKTTSRRHVPVRA